MNKLDVRDWFVMVMLAAIAIFGGLYLWKHPSDVNYAAWGAVVATLTGALHWINVQDDKKRDD